jgi:predicted DCC family thiol-disulfide oxidoreductase YuxK
MQRGVTSAQVESKPQPSNPASMDASEMTVVFDGDCPVCTAYTCNMSLDSPNTIVNARKGGKLVDDLSAAGIDLDEGMVVVHEGKYYHGADAVQILALHSDKSGLLGRLNHVVFRSPWRSRALYPILKMGRNMLLRALGRSRINSEKRG